MKSKAGGGVPPPVFFVFATILLFLDAGDQSFAIFLARVCVFSFLLLAVAKVKVTHFRLTVPDILLIWIWFVEVASLTQGAYRWITYQWFIHHSVALGLYGFVRWRSGLDEDEGEQVGIWIILAAVAQVALALVQKVFFAEGRSSGTLQNPNFLSEFLVVALAVSLFGCSKGGKRWLCHVVAAICLLGLGLTLSRGGIVLACILGFYFVGNRWGWRKAFATLVGLGMALLFTPNPLRDRFAGVDDPFAFTRFSIWRVATRMLLDHPFGVGLGQFKYYWSAYREPIEGSIVRYAKLATTPHGELFSVGSELGWPGLVLALGIACCVVVSFIRAHKSGNSTIRTASVLIALAGIHSLVECNLHVFGFLLMNSVIFAAVVSKTWTPVIERSLQVTLPIRLGSSILLVLFIVYSMATFAGSLLFDSGLNSFRSGDAAGALAKFRKASMIDPWRSTPPDSASLAAYRLYERDRNKARLSESLEYMQEALSRNPVDFRYPARVAFLLEEMARRSKRPEFSKIVLAAAFNQHDRAIRLAPHSADLRYNKAVALNNVGLREDAISLMREVLVDEPRYAKGWMLLGTLSAESDRPLALVAYRTALDVRSQWLPKMSEAYEKDFLDVDEKRISEMIRRIEGGK